MSTFILTYKFLDGIININFEECIMNGYENIFANNKYTRYYFSIIHNAKLEKRIKSYDGTLESHHILPKSLGGNNSKNNLVLLTCKEHYICHLLLTKMVSNDSYYKMLCAYKRMSNSTKINGKLNSGLYAKIKESHASLAKERYKDKPRPQHVIDALIIANTGKPKLEETKSKLRALWIGTKRSEEDRKKISIGQTGRTHSANQKLNIIKGRCRKFLENFYLHFNELTEENIIIAKDTGIIKRRTCLSIDTIVKSYGLIPSKEDILQKTYDVQQEELSYLADNQ